MANWEKYWSSYPTKVGGKDYFRQVGKTVHGQAISSFQFQHLIDGIVSQLDLQPEDDLLDLCCGNGLITSKLALKCRKVIGVDYSKPLLDVARRDHQLANIQYVQASVLALNPETLSTEGPFSKILMYEALQHFSKKDLQQILGVSLSLSTPEAAVLIGSIPDRTRKGNFYNTPGRRLVAVWRQVTGRNAIGSWWTCDEIGKIAERMKFQWRCLPQNEALHTAHYRFDALLKRLPSVEHGTIYASIEDQVS